MSSRLMRTARRRSRARRASMERRRRRLFEKLEPRIVLDSTWTGGVNNGGLFSTPGNWNPGTPGANDVAVINDGGSIKLDGDQVTAGLDVSGGNASIDLNGKSYSLDEADSVVDKANLSVGAAGTGLTLTNTGTVTALGIDNTNGGTLTVENGASLVSDTSPTNFTKNDIIGSTLSLPAKAN